MGNNNNKKTWCFLCKACPTLDTYVVTIPKRNHKPQEKNTVQSRRSNAYSPHEETEEPVCTNTPPRDKHGT